MQPTNPRKLLRIVGAGHWLTGAGLGLAALLAGSAVLARPSLSDTFVDDLRFVDRGSVLSADASVFGLSRKRDAFVSLLATAELDVVCINPGGKEVPSQKPEDVELDVDGDAFYPRHAIQYGRLDIDVETDAIAKKLAGAPDCPNKNWTERVVDVQFSQVRLAIRQGNEIELDLFCVFDPPTEDGKVSSNRVKCFSF
jgi:hypothetical protein